ncbi:2-dehydro-3-deoxyglucarate aldolase [Hyphomicrobiales bacterium]|nr:2-dehydro-3-deoxyglucarate aldolase [Hyphomicrobiales bacterium]CAH1695762.1 2-dehydro-3-deoxyglucarate aldolase [Hyphomicrobiales bacterium]
MFVFNGRSLRQHLHGGGQFGVFWFSLGAPALIELATTVGPDAIVIDAQHGLWDRRSLEQAVAATGGKVPLLVRTMDSTKGAISSALDAGAAGVIAPLIETPEEARRVVEAARFPPHGARSGGGVRPLAGDFAAYYAAANTHTLVGVMIETTAGVANADAIAAVEGVDLVLIGTGDLAISLGTFPAAGPRHEEACNAVLAACRKAGVACGIFTPHAEAAVKRAAQGYNMTVVANDIDVVSRGFASAQSAFRGGDAGSS